MSNLIIDENTTLEFAEEMCKKHAELNDQYYLLNQQDPCEQHNELFMYHHAKYMQWADVCENLK